MKLEVSPEDFTTNIVFERFDILTNVKMSSLINKYLAVAPHMEKEF